MPAPNAELGRFQIRLVPIAGALDAARETLGHVLLEPTGRSAPSVAHQIADDELIVGIQPQPRPQIARHLGSSLRGRNVLLLGMAKRPNLIALHTLRVNVSHRLVVELGARLAGLAQQRAYCVVGDARHAGRSAHGHSFTQKREDVGSFGADELVHGVVHTTHAQTVKHRSF